MKKNVFITLLLMCVAGMTYAQEAEPEFVGEAVIVNGDKVIPLNKEYSQVKTKAAASMYIVGIGTVKSKINIKGGSATARVNKEDDFYLIVKAVDNNSDPMSIVNIFEFETSKKARKAELSSANTYGGVNNDRLAYVEYTAKKYGKTSYLIKLKKPSTGEFGVMVRNPNNRDEKQIIVACFGVD